jgi:hypothetical protein
MPVELGGTNDPLVEEFAVPRQIIPGKVPFSLGRCELGVKRVRSKPIIGGIKPRYALTFVHAITHLNGTVNHFARYPKG